MSRIESGWTLTGKYLREQVTINPFLLLGNSATCKMVMSFFSSCRLFFSSS